MKTIYVTGLIVALSGVLSINKVIEVICMSYHWAADNIIAVIMFICLGGLMFTISGCSTAKNTLNLTVMASSAVDMVNSWETDRLILLEYSDKASGDVKDELTAIVESGDAIAAEISYIVVSKRIPSIGKINTVLGMVDELVVSGSEVYKENIQYVAYSDRIKAIEFGERWNNIKTAVASLDANTSDDDRYGKLKEILNLVALLATKVVVPALVASGRL